jgi:xanthine dehydrogenase iron-sulfur cluster and FAD-binding subunit A
VTKLALTINGRAHGPVEVRDELTMNDFLREFLGLTGTKFGCGTAQFLCCAVIVDNPDGTSVTSPTCIVPAVRFNGKAIRTVEGARKRGRAAWPHRKALGRSPMRGSARRHTSPNSARCCFTQLHIDARHRADQGWPASGASLVRMSATGITRRRLD